MGRVSFLLLVIGVAIALPATAAASGEGPEQGTVVLVDLALEASNGLDAHLESSEDGMFILELEREGQSVRYVAPGEATERGLKVRFGRLGLIDVAFAATKTLNSTEPGKGCEGAPRTLREGVFAGTIDFTGEREFTRIEGPQATGSMSVIPQWECLEATDPLPVLRACRRRPPEAGRAKENRRRWRLFVAVSRAISSPASPTATAAGKASSWVSRSNSAKT